MEITIFNGKTLYKWPFSIAMFVYRGYMSTAWVTFWGRCFLPMRHHTCFLILAIGCPQASRPYGNVPNLSHHFRLAGEIPFGTKKLSVKVIYIYHISILSKYYSTNLDFFPSRFTQSFMANHLSVKPCKHVILRYSESVEGQMLPQNGKRHEL